MAIFIPCTRAKTCTLSLNFLKKVKRNGTRRGTRKRKIRNAETRRSDESRDQNPNPFCDEALAELYINTVESYSQACAVQLYMHMHMHVQGASVQRRDERLQHSSESDEITRR